MPRQPRRLRPPAERIPAGTPSALWFARRGALACASFRRHAGSYKRCQIPTQTSSRQRARCGRDVALGRERPTPVVRRPLGAPGNAPIGGLLRRVVKVDHGDHMRFLAATLALGGVGLLMVGSVGAVPKPAAKFWSSARCERVMLARPLARPRQVLCVGSGGPSACRWTSGHSVRLYSEFTVFARYRQANVEGVGTVARGVVRSFTLATRARPDFVRIVSHWGDQYEGRPADFFKAHRRLLATRTTPARFRSMVSPLAAHLTQQENATELHGRVARNYGSRRRAPETLTGPRPTGS